MDIAYRKDRKILFIAGLILLAIVMAGLGALTKGATSPISIFAGLAYGFLGWTWVESGRR